MSNAYDVQIDTEDIQASEFAQQLTVPYCGPAKFRDEKIGAVTLEKKDKSESWDVVLFGFVLQDPDFKGIEHEEPIYEPDIAERGVDEVKKKKARIAYFLSFMTDEATAQSAMNKAKSWDSMRENAQKVIDHARETWKEKTLQIKVLGSTYGGVAKVRFPGYLGFLSDEDSERVVSFSPKELKENQAYLRAINSDGAASTEAVEDGEIDDGLGF